MSLDLLPVFKSSILVRPMLPVGYLSSDACLLLCGLHYASCCSVSHVKIENGEWWKWICHDDEKWFGCLYTRKESALVWAYYLALSANPAVELIGLELGLGAIEFGLNQLDNITGFLSLFHHIFWQTRTLSVGSVRLSVKTSFKCRRCFNQQMKNLASG